MEYDTDTIMNRLGQLDAKMLEDALRSLASEYGKEKVAEHVAKSIGRNIVIDAPTIENYVSDRMKGLKEEDIIGLASDYGMNTPDGLKEIASQLITEDIVDCFADTLVDLVSIGRDGDVRVCISAIVKAVRNTECPLTRMSGDYVSSYTQYLEQCLAENDPLKAFIEVSEEGE